MPGHNRAVRRGLMLQGKRLERGQEAKVKMGCDWWRRGSESFGLGVVGQ